MLPAFADIFSTVAAEPRSVAGAKLAEIDWQPSRRAAGQRCPGGSHTGASPRQGAIAESPVCRGSAPATTCVSLVVALGCLLAGCDFPGKPKLADRPVRSDQVVDFDRLFQQNCAGCHGEDGTTGPAPPLNDPIFLTIVADEELLRVIRDGRPGTPMAAFSREHGGPLTEAQVEALAAGLKPRWKFKVDEQLALPPYQAERRSPSSSTEEPTTGTTAFARACAGCHGENGEGTNDAGPINNRAFLGLISDQALRRLIITGRADLGMPNFAENDGRGDDYQPLSSAEIDELVALLNIWRRGLPSASLEKSGGTANRLSADAEGAIP